MHCMKYLSKYLHFIKGIDTLSRVGGNSKLICIPSEKRKEFAPLGSNYFPFSSRPPFQKGFGMLESKQVVNQIISLL